MEKNLLFIPLCLRSAKFIYFERTTQQIAQHKHAAISLPSKGRDSDPKESELGEPYIRRHQKLYTNITPIRADTVYILHNGDPSRWFCVFPLCLFTRDTEKKAKRDTNSHINVLAIKINLYLKKVTRGLIQRPPHKLYTKLKIREMHWPTSLAENTFEYVLHGTGKPKTRDQFVIHTLFFKRNDSRGPEFWGQIKNKPLVTHTISLPWGHTDSRYTSVNTP